MKNFVPCLLIVVIAASLCGCADNSSRDGIPTIKVGHVGHDHHLALFVAADYSEKHPQPAGLMLRTVRDRKMYELIDRGKKIANVEIVRVGGGSKMPTALAQNVIDVGLGGVAAVLACVDSGAPVKLIAPLHYKGDMFVVRPDYPAQNWPEFVKLAQRTEVPIKIGYKDPVAVAKVIFEEALRHEGISFSGDLSKTNLKVHMVNVKGGGKLNVSLAQGLIDGYVGNNPFPAIGIEKGMLRVICDLEELPPGTFRDHPCCCVAANTQALTDHPDEIAALLVLLLQATDTINTDMDSAVAAACRWIGTTQSVERMSIATSGYSMAADAQWHARMADWIVAMNGLNVFRDKLKGLPAKQVPARAYDLSLLNRAGDVLAVETEE